MATDVLTRSTEPELVSTDENSKATPLYPEVLPLYDLTPVFERNEIARRMRIDQRVAAIRSYQEHWKNVTGLIPPSRFVAEVAVLQSHESEIKLWQYGDLATYIAGSIGPEYCADLGLGYAGPGYANMIEEIQVIIDHCLMFALATDPRLRTDIPAAEQRYRERVRTSPANYGKDGVMVGDTLINAYGAPIARVLLHVFPNFLDNQERHARKVGGLVRRKGAIQLECLTNQPGLPPQTVSNYRTITWGMLDEERHPWTPRSA